MTSELNSEFLACFGTLPDRIKRKARKNYKLWKRNPSHPSLDFKQVGRRLPVFSIRIGLGWRALGLKEEETIIWFWIGSHAEYDQLLNRI